MTIEQENLELQIKTYNSNYRAGTPLCTDEAYDKLVEELSVKFPKSELLKKGVIESEPTTRKQRLPIPMFSLNKVKSLEEIKKWVKSKGLKDSDLVVITPKLDGISLVLNEETGDCFTRGDGEYGQESYKHFLLMRVSTSENNEHTFGEAIMSKKNFEQYKDKFANPRNMVAGLFNHKTPNKSLKDVHYIRYGSTAGGSKISQLLLLNKIDKNCKIDYISCFINKITEELLNELYSIWGEEYQIDGLVIEFNSSKIRNLLGREENMNPAYAVAYKNPEWSSSAVVKVTGITWQVSKQGKLKPVIQIEPTEIGGVTITNVTGYNAKYIFDNNIAYLSYIKIVRSGDVIPKHINTENFDLNQVTDLADELIECPCCGHITKWDETYTELVCTNSDCKDMKIAKLVHFFTTIGVEEFGEPSIKKLYDLGVETIPLFLNLHEDALSEVEGWGYKSANKLLSQFKQLKEVGVPLARLLHSLSLGEGKIGEKTYQLILDNKILGFLPINKHSIELLNHLISIDGVAEITAKEFINNMIEFRNLYEDNLPIKISNVQSPKQIPTGDKMSGHKVCFTGFRDKELEKFVVDNGGEVVSGVSSKTTVLVVKDINSGSSKLVKANELGIMILERSGFVKYFNIL